jgi:hypothetical protein
MSITLRTLLSAGVAASAALLVGCATPEAPSTSSALSQADQALRQANPGTAVALTVTPAQVRIGEAITLQVASARAGYLYVFQVSTDGKALSMVFPNAMDGANYVPAGTAPTQLPRPNWRMTTKGPAGVGYFLAVVADKQQDLTLIPTQLKDGRVAIEGPYGAAMSTLREVAP